MQATPAGNARSTQHSPLYAVCGWTALLHLAGTHAGVAKPHIAGKIYVRNRSIPVFHKVKYRPLGLMRKNNSSMLFF